MFYWLSQTCWRISPYSLWTHFYSYDFFFYFGSWPYMLCCSFRLLPPPPRLFFECLESRQAFIPFLLVNLKNVNLSQTLYNFSISIFTLYMCFHIYRAREQKRETTDCYKGSFRPPHKQHCCLIASLNVI